MGGEKLHEGLSHDVLVLHIARQLGGRAECHVRTREGRHEQRGEGRVAGQREHVLLAVVNVKLQGPDPKKGE